MEEAVEICKLRLFLQLVAQVEARDRIEPLPDIDFNIRAGNMLVGYTRITDIRSGQATIYFHDQLRRIEDQVEQLDSVVDLFREQQTRLNRTFTPADTLASRARFAALKGELHDLLAAECGVKMAGMQAWKSGHKPFHWLCDFHRIMNSGGFDVIIGNPPYVELAKMRSDYGVRGYSTAECGNLFALALERCFALASETGLTGLIVPLSLVSTERMTEVRRLVLARRVWLPCFDMRPSSLFEGVAQRLTIMIQSRAQAPAAAAGRYRRWLGLERASLAATMWFEAGQPSPQLPFPKICSRIESAILAKVAAPPLETFVHSDARPLFVHRIVRYFVKAPQFRSSVSERRRGTVTIRRL